MAHLPTIIVDLALMLLIAGFTTILFKKLKQPLVLGYIIAGLLTGPHLSFFPTIGDPANIQTWSEIGVIFLMFALGLEFSFYKLKTVGSTAFIATSVAVGGMIIAGYTCGNLMGWSHMDSMFLGGMLSMSSTAIIIKAFDDLQLKQEKFANMVFGILIIEDIAGIVMMVMLSTLAATTAQVSTMELLAGVARLVFCLVLWFMLGMYLIPSFFKAVQPLMNKETRLVASVGLCLGMVVVATHMGFSSALGAFIMGSLIAEAPDAEEIEEVIAPLKDLFGAVFFVSVGMLVNPQLLLEYAVPVCILILLTICGQIFFATLGVLTAGQKLNTALRCGFSLCQIGEFSFIIASLGMSLKVTSDFLYPIIVAVSVITTFTTPFCIMAAEPAQRLAQKYLPQKFQRWLERYTENNNDNNKDQDWLSLIQNYILQMVIYTTLLLALAIGSQFYLLPYLQLLAQDLGLPPYGHYVTALATLLFMAPLLRVMLTNRVGSGELFSILWFKKRANHLPLMVLVFGKFLLAATALYHVFHVLVGLNGAIALAAILVAAYFISTSDWLMGEYLRIEARFLVNLNEKHMRRHRASLGLTDSSSLLDQKLYIGTYKVAAVSPLVGKALFQIGLKEKYGCNILQIKNKNQIIDYPGGKDVIKGRATILFIGTLDNFKALNAANIQQQLLLEILEEPITLREFTLSTKNEEQKFVPCALTIDETSPLLGQCLKTADMRHRWQCLVIGLERGDYTLTDPHVSMVFEKKDLLWVLGKQTMMNNLIRQEVM